MRALEVLEDVEVFVDEDDRVTDGVQDHAVRLKEIRPVRGASMRARPSRGGKVGSVDGQNDETER